MKGITFFSYRENPYKTLCRKSRYKGEGLLMILVILSWLIIPSQASAQQINQWETYTSYSTVNDMVRDHEGRLWTATTGGLFSYQNDSVLVKLTTLDGMSNLDAAAIDYDESRNQIFLGYVNGTIDILNADNLNIESHNEIRRAERFSPRGINDFEVYENTLFVATDFGIVNYDLETLLVQDTYSKLGSFGTAIAASQVFVDDDTMYIATREGVAVGDLDQNLREPSAWMNHESDSVFASQSVQSVIHHDGKIYASTASENYVYDGLSWQNVDKFGATGILFWQKQRVGSRLFGISEEGIFCDTLCDQNQFALPGNTGIRAFLVSADDPVRFWIGTGSQGIAQGSPQNDAYTYFKPEGPWLNFFNALKAEEDVLLATSELNFPSLSPLAEDMGYYLFRDGKWENYNMRTHQTLRNRNFRRVVSLASTEDNYYFGSWGQGIARHHRQTDSIKVFKADNSNLVGLGGDYIVTVDLEVDSEQRVWATSYLADKPLFYMQDGEESWTGLSRHPILSTSDHYFNIHIDSFDQKWISLNSRENNGRGLLVLDTGEDPTDPSDDVAVKLTEDVNQGNLPDAKVEVIQEDNEGEVWIGTNRGVARFIIPERVIRGGSADRRAQWLINADTTAESPFLLRDISATSMAVNAANQKWIGSSDNGVWLVNEDGSRILKHFTRDNSPLLGNQVNGITIDQQSGTVYFSTAQGLISYTDVPKESVENMSSLDIYPNPFSYDKHSQGVIIENLSDRTTVRILSIDGRLIEQMDTAGGRIIWDGKDGRGNKVASGVYLVVALGENGDKAIGKLAIVR